MSTHAAGSATTVKVPIYLRLWEALGRSIWDSSAKFREQDFGGMGIEWFASPASKGEGNEFNVTSHPKLHDGGYVATFLMTTDRPNESLHIHAFYDGHWSFAVSPADMDFEAPPSWPVNRSWGTVNEHSETLEIEVPNDARLSVVDRITSLG